MNEKTVKRWTPSDDIAGSMTDEYQTGPYVASRDHDAIVSALRLRLSDQATYGAEQLGAARARERELTAMLDGVREVMKAAAVEEDALRARVAVLEAALRWCATHAYAGGKSFGDLPIVADALSPPSELPELPELSAVKGEK